jgi:hypothetical protein
MPVIINSQEIHPFLPSLGSPLAIDRSRPNGRTSARWRSPSSI